MKSLSKSDIKVLSGVKGQVNKLELIIRQFNVNLNESIK